MEVYNIVLWAGLVFVVFSVLFGSYVIDKLIAWQENE